MGQISFGGSITIGPTIVTDTNFPGATGIVALSCNPNPKPTLVDSGFTVRTINSAGAYVPLRGVALNGDAVSQGDTLVVRTIAPMWLRLTFNGIPSPIVSEIPIFGTLVIEVPTANTQDAPNYLTTLEIKGVGTVEYLVSGLA